MVGKKQRNASHDQSTRYVLTLTPEQAHVVSKACELYTRLHLGQLYTLTWELMDVSRKDFCECRDAADTLLRALKQIYFPDLAPLPGASHGIGNNLESDRAWDVYQVIRHAIAWHEQPAGGGTVDFRPPFSVTNEPLATCEVQNA